MIKPFKIDFSVDNQSTLIPSFNHNPDYAFFVTKTYPEYFIHWILRISLFLTFIGLGMHTFLYPKLVIEPFTTWFWSPYFLAAGLLNLAIISFLYLRPIYLYFMIFINSFLLLYPLVYSLNFEKFIENFYLMVSPIVFLMTFNPQSLFQEIEYLSPFSKRKAVYISWVIRIILFLNLMSRGISGVFLEDKLLLSHYTLLGWTSWVSDPQFINFIFGSLEMVLAIAIIIKPKHFLLLFLFIWKMFTESIFIFSEPSGGFWIFLTKTLTFTLPLVLMFLNMNIIRQSSLLGVASTDEFSIKFSFKKELLFSILRF